MLDSAESIAQPRPNRRGEIPFLSTGDEVLSAILACTRVLDVANCGTSVSAPVAPTSELLKVALLLASHAKTRSAWLAVVG